MNIKQIVGVLVGLCIVAPGYAAKSEKKQANTVSRTKQVAPYLPVAHNGNTLYYQQNKEYIQNSNQTMRASCRKIEEATRNAVVQIFSHIAEYNFLQPYSTPQQGTVSGSGFFINEQGYILTNMHVVDQAVGVYIQMPVMGKRLMKAAIIGICPDRDFALLKVSKLDCQAIIAELGTIPFLALGNSDDIVRTDEVFAVGYPLGQDSLKITKGILSGGQHVHQMRQYFLQIDAAINPGSSGGPLVDHDGFVVGVNTAGIEANSVGYAIPVNEIKIVLADLLTQKIVRKPILGAFTIKGDEHLTAYLGNPLPGGAYIVELLKDGPLALAGIQVGDMIYEVNGHHVDVYGELRVQEGRDKISLFDYVTQFAIGSTLHFVVYRHGEKMEFSFPLTSRKPHGIERRFPWHETLDFEVFAGMVIMPLTLNHVRGMQEQMPGLLRFALPTAMAEEVLLISHIFSDSIVASRRVLMPGFTLREVNGQEVKTMNDFRNAVQKSLETGRVVIRAVDQVSAATDNVLAVLPLDEVLQETVDLSSLYHYPLSDMVTSLCQERNITIE